MDLGLKGKRAIVTGASSGIGYETARLFLEEGARVLICARTSDKLLAARDRLAKQTNGEIHAVEADMAREADVSQLIDTAVQQSGSSTR
jgi:3-oxoacyl-[acyl-carrier protein] reductase